MILIYAIAEYSHGPKHVNVVLPLTYPLPPGSFLALQTEVRRLCNMPDDAYIVIANIMPLSP